MPDITKTETEELEEIQLEPKEDEKCESEDEIPEEIEVEEAATDEEAEKSEGQKNFDRMMKEVDNHDNQNSEEQGVGESDEVMEVEVDEEVKDAIEKRISGGVETKDAKENIEASTEETVNENGEAEKDVREGELPNEVKEEETMVSI